MNKIKEIYMPNGERAGHLLVGDYKIEAYSYNRVYIARFDFISGITDRNGNHTQGTPDDLEKMVIDYYILMHPEQ